MCGVIRCGVLLVLVACFGAVALIVGVVVVIVCFLCFS